MFQRWEKKPTNKQLYDVIQSLLAYEKQYHEQEDSAFGESLEDYIIRAFSQHNHYLQSGLESIDNTGILRLFIDSMPAAMPTRSSVSYGTSSGSMQSIHATPVDAIPTVEAHAIPSSVSATAFNQRSSPFSIPKIEVNHYHYGQRRNSGMSDFVMGFLIGRDSGRSAPRNRDNHSSKDDCLKKFLFRLAALVIFMLSVGSLVYLAGQINDIGERSIYNEGRSYALLSAACLGVSAVSALFASTSLVPLILLATAASNPVSWAIFGVIAGTLILTAMAHAMLTQFIEPMLQDTFETKFGSTSFVSGDLGRVQLTQAEADRLEKRNIDPMKVRCAIALIREKMGAEPIVNKWGIQALFNAEGARRGDNQKHLETIRKLRSGKITEVDVGNRKIHVSSMKPAFMFQGDYRDGSHEPFAPLMGSDFFEEKRRQYGDY